MLNFFLSYYSLTAFILVFYSIYRVFEKEGVKLVVDDKSYDFVKGATIDYVEELIRAAFQVSHDILLSA